MKWPTKTLGDLFHIARGGSPRPIDDFITDDPDGVNWIMIGDASESSKYISKTRKRIRKEGVARSRLVKPGDFLLTNSMSFGKPYILRTHGCIHDGWLVLTPRDEGIDPDYFYHLLGSPEIYTEFSRLAAGATVKNLNIDLVQSVRVRVPPVSEQRRIAVILDQAEALRAKRIHSMSHNDALMRSQFESFFGDVRFRKETVRLDSLVRANDNVNYGVVQPGDDYPGGIPVIRVGDFATGTLDTSNVKTIDPRLEAAYRRSRLLGTELLISCVGSIGAVVASTNAEQGFNIARAVARVPLDQDRIHPVYLLHYLRSSWVQDYFRNQLRTVAQPTLNIKQINETPVWVPSKEMQKQFASFASGISTLGTHLKGSLSRLNALSSALQHRAFRGEL